MSALRPPARRSRRGSVLIVAMLLAAIIGVSLVSYIKVCLNSASLANRSFYDNAAMNLAEIGLEEAMYCYNQLDTVSTAASAWGAGWTIASDNSVTRTITGFTPGPGATAVIKVYCQHYNPTSANPVVVSQSLITPASGPTISRYIEITLRRRSLFATGLVARNSISWTGHPSADSWNSDPDNDSSTAAVAYSTASGVRQANCTVGCVSTASGAIDLASGSVYGYVSSGGGGISGGSVISGSLTGTGIDPTHVSYDFSATFPSVTVPTPTTSNVVASSISATTTFPRSGDSSNAADSVYYYNFASGAGISLSGGSKNIQIAAANKVTFLFNNHNAVTAFSLSGNAYLSINSGATLQIYSNGNLDISGNGVANTNSQPASCLIYGTSTSVGGQSITVSGNGQLKSAVYAPNATVTANGGGSSGQIQGAIIADAIIMHGGADFHYDEALGNLGSGNPFGITKWRELTTAADRATYASALAF